MALVADWKLDEAVGTSGANSIIDYSGNDYHGTPVNAVVTERSPLNTTGIVFNGTDDFISGDDTIISGYPMSMGIWFNTIHDEYRSFISIGSQQTALRNIKLGYNSTALPTPGITFALKIDQFGLTKAVTSPVPVLDGNWHLAIGVAETETERTLYVDGAGTTATPLSHSWYAVMDKFAIGVTYQDNPAGTPFLNQYHKGGLSSAKIWNSIITQDQARAMWEEGVRQWCNQIADVSLPRPRIINV